MVINKELVGDDAGDDQPRELHAAATAQVWQLTSANTITRLADLTFSGTAIVATLPAQSITLFVVPASGTATPPDAPTNLRIVRAQ